LASSLEKGIALSSRVTALKNAIISKMKNNENQAPLIDFGAESKGSGANRALNWMDVLSNNHSLCSETFNETNSTNGNDETQSRGLKTPVLDEAFLCLVICNISQMFSDGFVYFRLFHESQTPVLVRSFMTCDFGSDNLYTV
jgi:hypothetical protein